MPDPNDNFLPAMSAIAREAGALLMDYFHQHLKIEYKGEADLVTAADRASEVLIRDRIRRQWPAHDVLGEEQGLSDQGSEYRWYVDPLDGTTNFAHGFPVFCVSLGLEHQTLKDRAAGKAGSRIAAVAFQQLAPASLADYAAVLRPVLESMTVGRWDLAAFCDRRSYSAPKFWFHTEGSKAAENMCGLWLRDLVQRGRKPATKATIRKTALIRFTGLTERGFNRVWPPEWGTPGAPRKRKPESA